jgi:3-methyladenine DNA glycosylase AlkD
MTVDEVMNALEKAGSEQTKKTFKRHGMREPLFGVKYGDLGVLVKKIKVDHALAKALWKTGNGDARALATMIADPSAVTLAELDGWAKDVHWYGGADAIAKLAGRSPHAQELLQKWTSADAEWVERAGWHLLAGLAGESGLPDAFFEPWLPRITKEIHGAKNFVRDGMNTALIAIGGRSAGLRAKAEAAAKKIGPVEVDWGDTNCETKDAIPYIAKMWAHKEQKGAAKTKSAPKPAAAKKAPAKKK